MTPITKSSHALLCAASIAVVLSTGCAAKREAVRFNSGAATAFNEAQANAENEMTLVNIMRARDRLPRHFTAIGAGSHALTESNTGTFSYSDVRSRASSSALTLSRALSRALSFGKTVQDSPRLDFRPLGLQQFTTGYISTFTSQTIETLSNQGFDQGFLLHLLTKDVTLQYTCNAVNSALESQRNQREQDVCQSLIRNDPGDPTYGDFQRLVRIIVQSGNRFRRERLAPEIVAGPFNTEDQLELEALKQNLKANDPRNIPAPACKQSSNGSWTKCAPDERENYWAIFGQGSFASGWELSCPPDLTQVDLGSADSPLRQTVEQTCNRKPNGEQSQDPFVSLSLETRNSRGCGDANRQAPCPKIRATVRSPESVIYYLGQLVREQQLGMRGQEITYPAMREGRMSEYKIITVWPGEKPERNPLGEPMQTWTEASIEFDYDGILWTAGGTASNDRTLSTLALIQILIALQTDVKELQTTQQLIIGQ